MSKETEIRMMHNLRIEARTSTIFLACLVVELAM